MPHRSCAPSGGQHGGPSSSSPTSFLPRSAPPSWFPGARTSPASPRPPRPPQLCNAAGHLSKQSRRTSRSPSRVLSFPPTMFSSSSLNFLTLSLCSSTGPRCRHGLHRLDAQLASALFLDGPALRPRLLPLKTRAGVCFAAPPRRPSALLRLVPDAGREPAPSPCLLVCRVQAPPFALPFAPDSAPPSDSVAPVPFRPVPAEAASPEPLQRAAAPLLYLLLLHLFFSNKHQLARLASL